MENVKKNTLGKSILKALKRRLKPTHILFFALIISANAFAWFIYMDKITSNIDVRVKAWNVSFQFNNQSMSDYVNFVVSDIYPGMTPFSQTLNVTNDGEVAANLSYEIVSVRIFDDTYATVDEGGTYTSDQLVTLMRDNYPFRITISTSQSTIGAYGGTASFTFNVTWLYESVGSGGVSNDAIDTYWGNQAYLYKQNNPSTPCINVVVKLSAIQVQSQS